MSAWAARFASCALLVGIEACAPVVTPRACPDSLRIDARPFDGSRLLAGAFAKGRAAGATTAVPSLSKVAEEGEDVGRFAEISKERCAAFVARAGGSVRDIDAYVFDEAGELIASDEAPTSDAAVMVCPPHPGRVYVVFRVMSGLGIVALGALDVPPTAADAVARALGVHGRPGEDTGKLAVWPGLETRLRERRTALGVRWEDVRRAEVALEPHAPTVVSVAVEAERCLDLYALGDDSIGNLALDVVDSEGRVVARGRGFGNEQSALVCARSPETVAVELRPRGSIGRAALVVARSEPRAFVSLATRAELVGLAPLLPMREALERHRSRTSSLTLGAPEPRGQGEAASGRVSSVPVSIPAGCSRLDVVGGAPLGRFRVELWTNDGALVDEAEGGASAALFRCARTGESLRVDVTSLADAGPFVLEVRSGPGLAPVLGASARAAARALQHLEAPSSAVEPKLLADAQPVALEAERMLERSIPLPVGCTEVVLASDDAVSLEATLAVPGEVNAATMHGFATISTEVCVKRPTQGALRVRASSRSSGLLFVRSS